MHSSPHAHLFIGFKPKFSLQSASGHVRRVDSFRGQDFRYCCSVCAKSAAFAVISHEIRTGKSYVLFSILSQGSSNITLSPKCDHTKEELHTHFVLELVFICMGTNTVYSTKPKRGFRTENKVYLIVISGST